MKKNGYNYLVNKLGQIKTRLSINVSIDQQHKQNWKEHLQRMQETRIQTTIFLKGRENWVDVEKME